MNEWMIVDEFNLQALMYKDYSYKFNLYCCRFGFDWKWDIFYLIDDRSWYLKIAIHSIRMVTVEQRQQTEAVFTRRK